MTQLSALMPIRLTADEWRRTGDGEHLYELVEGNLKMVPAELPRNARVVAELSWILGSAARAHQGQRSFMVLGPIQLETSLPGEEFPTYRITDLTICRAGTDSSVTQVALADVLTAIEIVSPSNADVDYLHKRAEYARVGIPTYLIVDVRPGHERLLVLVLDDTGDEPLYRIAADGTAVTLDVAGSQIPISIADLTG